MKIAKTLNFLAFFCIICGTGMAQDLIFSQFYNAPVHINSGFAGTVAYPRFSASYRLQWPGITKTYETYAVTYDQFFPDQNIGLGAVVFNDDQGDGTLRLTRAKGIVSYNLSITKELQLKFGVGVGYVQNRLDFDRLIFSVDRFGNPVPNTETPPDQLNNGFLDLDMGLLLYNPYFYVGASLFHLNGPYDGFLSDEADPSALSLPALISIHGGTQIVLETDNKAQPTTFISPNLIYAFQSGFHQFNLGAYFQRNAVFGGVAFRHVVENPDAVILSAGVHVNNLKISYSYDVTVSSLELPVSGGSHEIGLSLGLRHLEKKQSTLNDCFSLFR